MNGIPYCEHNELIEIDGKQYQRKTMYNDATKHRWFQYYYKRKGQFVFLSSRATTLMKKIDDAIALENYSKNIEAELFYVLQKEHKIPYNEDGYKIFMEVFRKHFPVPPEFKITVQPYSEITDEQRRNRETPKIFIEFKK